MMRRLIKMMLLLGLVSPLAAQQMDSQIKKESSEVLELTKEQSAAILLIEREFQERETRSAERNKQFQMSTAERAQEREAKIKQILNPAQWEEYQKFSEAMREGEAQMKMRKKGKPIQGNKPIKID